MGRDWAGWGLATDAFRRLSNFGATVQPRVASVRKSAKRQRERGLRWLRQREQPVAVVIVGCVLLYLGLPYGPKVWSAYKADRDNFTPFFTPIGALLVGIAAFGQWRTARLRHEEQTNADRQRRITESFSKAVEQLASDKLEVRLGGIYSLERISKESPDDYWTVMETLCAFVRERARWKGLAASGNKGEEPDLTYERYSKGPPMHIAAALAVIVRRRLPQEARKREEEEELQLVDLSGADLRWAYLSNAHLEGAVLWGSHLEGSLLCNAYLDGCYLVAAHLEDADVRGANFAGAHLEGANLSGVLHLEGADLSEATGDAITQLPDGIPRPAHWPRLRPPLQDLTG